MENTTKIRVPKMYQEMLELVEQDADGYWAYAKEGFIFEGMGCGTAHEDTQKDLLEMIRTLKEDDNAIIEQEEALEEEAEEVQEEEVEQESVQEVQSEEQEEQIEQDEKYIHEVQVIVDIDSYIQGIHLNQYKTYSNFMKQGDKEANEEALEQLLYVALYRLDENLTIDIVANMSDGTQESVGRITHKWGNIELRKPAGTQMIVHEEYEREGHWKKRMKDFIKEQLEKIEQPEQEQEVYWYEYIHRGFSLGCQPKGFIDREDDKGRFGWIAYDRELTEQEINDYELRPVG